MASISFPVIGTKEFRNAFSAYAHQKGQSMAELIRVAIDEKYGDELKPYLSFFTIDGLEIDRVGDKETENV